MRLLVCLLLLLQVLLSSHSLYHEDYDRLPGYTSSSHTPFDFSELERLPLNGSMEQAPFFEYLQKRFHIKAAVETGTLLGSTTLFFSALFDKVHTIELDKSTYRKAKKFLRREPNIQCHLGSSETVLQKLLPHLEGVRTLFYLDAHWEEHWPLLQEIAEIAKTHKDNCLLVIDDFKVPHREDLRYAAYNSKRCSYKYIKNSLNALFSDYLYYYLIPKNPWRRARFLAIPTKWLGSEPFLLPKEQ